MKECPLSLEVRRDLIRVFWQCANCKDNRIITVDKRYTACPVCKPLHDLWIKYKCHLHDVMDIYASPGSKVIFEHGLNGWSGEGVRASEHLELGEQYTVDYLEVFDSSSTVYLKEVPDVGFNTVLFAPVEPYEDDSDEDEDDSDEDEDDSDEDEDDDDDEDI